MEQYIITQGIWHCEEENFENGCLLDTSKTIFIDMDIKQGTLKDAIAQLREEYNIRDVTEMEFNACDEKGRIDICWSSATRFNMSRVGAFTLGQFRRGERNMYYNTLSVYVAKTTDVDLNAEVLKEVL